MSSGNSVEDGSEESKLWGERQVRRISVMHVRDHEDLEMKMVAAGMHIVKKS